MAALTAAVERLSTSDGLVVVLDLDATVWLPEVYTLRAPRGAADDWTPTLGTDVQQGGWEESDAEDEARVRWALAETRALLSQLQTSQLKVSFRFPDQHASFMEDLGREAQKRGYVPPMSGLEEVNDGVRRASRGS